MVDLLRVDASRCTYLVRYLVGDEVQVSLGVGVDSALAVSLTETKEIWTCKGGSLTKEERQSRAKEQLVRNSKLMTMVVASLPPNEDFILEL